MSTPHTSEDEIFRIALGIPAREVRDAYLAQACGNDAAQIARLQALLKIAADEKSFLEQPAAAFAPTVVPRTLSETAGTLIGPYKLLEPIGEGGFGVVFMAEQQHPVRRKVALKVIKPGMDSRAIIARFEAERQALALMDHPNIARVFDAGETDSGRPYFVMELVRGISITQFCDEAQMPARERLELFLSVCQAAQHAHQKGIIHRDLKPSNVLVTLHDGKPVVKVIDFGIAKATGHQLTDKTLFTGFAQMVGTPLYMSPEQAALSGLDIDTRSDIYSLGVLLYELLTGTTPLEKDRLQKAAFDEVRRLIQQEEPVRPSTRVSSLGAGAAAVFTVRRTEPAQLSRTLRNELDWIVLKALEKDRNRRYDTAGAFATDIGRYLRDEPVEACPPSVSYRLRKMVSRNRLSITVASVVAASLLAGTALATWFAIEAGDQRDKALASARAAEAARESEAEQRTVAEQRRQELAVRQQETEAARKSEAEQRTVAEQQQAVAEKQRDEADHLKREAETRSAELRRLAEQQRRSLYASDMNVVRTEAARGNLRRVREILLSHLPLDGKEDLRGFEWNYWYRYQNQARELMKIDGFDFLQAAPGDVSELAPGGAVVAVMNDKNQTQLLNTSTGAVLATFDCPLNRLWDKTRTSRTGRMAKTFANSRAARLSEPKRPVGVKPTQLAENDQVGSAGEFLLLEPDGTSTSVAFPVDSFSHVCGIDISDDGNCTALLGIDVSSAPDQPVRRVLVWNHESGQYVLNQTIAGEWNQLRLSPDGTRVAFFVNMGKRSFSTDARDVALVLSVADGQEMGRVVHSDYLYSVHWLPDQTSLLMLTSGFSSSTGARLLKWNTSDPNTVSLSQETMPAFPSAAVSPDGRRFAVSSHATPFVQVIDTERGDVIQTLRHEALPVHSLAFSPDGQTLIGCGTSGEVFSWDVGEDEDLYALQSRPLKPLARGGFAVSPDQMLLGVVQSQTGAVLIRTREGEEVLLDPGFSGRILSNNSFLQFSPDSRSLAFISTMDESLLSMPVTKRRVELYDLESRSRLWRTFIDGRSLSRTPMAGDTNASECLFEHERLLIRYANNSLAVLDTASGTQLHPKPENEQSQLFLTGLNRLTGTGQILVGGLETIPRGLKPPMRSREVFLRDAVTLKTVQASDHPDLNSGEERTPLPGRIVPFPDGLHVAVLRIPQNLVEVWNLQRNLRVMSATGKGIVVSDSGNRFAVLQLQNFRTLAQTVSTVSRVTAASVWDLQTGAVSCSVDLEGNPADQLRFSPDGKRLVTLHGWLPDNSGDIISQAILWDAGSGREILSIPVADSNQFYWDLQFDPSGHRLDLLCFGRHIGTGGGGYSRTWDARPQSAEADAQLIVDVLLQELVQQSPLPEDLEAAVTARPGLPQQVRELALQSIQSKCLDLDAIEKSCRDVLLNRFAAEEQYQHAFRLAKAIQKTEPESRRSRILIGAAQMRCGHTEQAIATLEERPNDPLAKDGERIALLLLCEMQRGAGARRQGQLWGRMASRASQGFSAEVTLQMELSTQVWMIGAIFLPETATHGPVTLARPLWPRFLPFPSVL